MRLVLALASIAAAAALAAAAAPPAFTSDNGSVTFTVNVPAPPAPCLTLSPTTVDFGTKNFSTPTHEDSALVNLSLGNCGTADENVAASGTDASGPSGSWSLRSDITGAGVCALGTNQYGLLAEGPFSAPGSILTYFDKAPHTLGSYAGLPFAFPHAPAAAEMIQLFLEMPCQGSNGAGETKSFSATFTALVA